MQWLLVSLTTIASAIVAWGAFEAGWLRTRVVEVALPGLPAELDGLRIGHLSDFHLGPRSRGTGATRRAVAWVAERRPDLVCITGDLVSHPRGEARLREHLGRLGRPYVVLGNHDVALSRDPFSRGAELEDLRGAALLRDEAESVLVRGVRVQVVGVDPAAYVAGTSQPARLADPQARLRVLLCHFPAVVRTLPPGAFQLVLAGHLHAGQINVPYPGGRLTLAHPRARWVAGLYRTAAGALHVSPGTGTTFVPLRLCARPEVTELVVRSR